ncbi:MAG: phosphoribosylformylglycinamidine synthase subunit PurS [Pseudomonadota bacterium]
MKARIYISLKNGVFDPNANAIESSLVNLGFNDINNLKIGKFIDIDIANDNMEEATEQLTKMCDKLLANNVIEDYKIELK